MLERAGDLCGISGTSGRMVEGIGGEPFDDVETGDGEVAFVGRWRGADSSVLDLEREAGRRPSDGGPTDEVVSSIILG